VGEEALQADGGDAAEDREGSKVSWLLWISDSRVAKAATAAISVTTSQPWPISS
jgi:hypothetical protein